MYDFLTFNSFITPKILIIVYYLGVFFLPVVVWRYRKKIKIFYDAYKSENKPIIMLYMFGVFLLMQLFWRMMFEMMIGYFDMHTYLHQMVQQ
jgi:hypothetical protein